MKWMALVFLMGGAMPLWGVTYITLDQALALAFENPEGAKRHELLFDMEHRRAIEKRLDEKVEQRGVLAYSGKLKSGSKPGAVLFDAVIGKHELIDYMAALDSEGKICFVEILAYRESYGGQIRNKNWRDQFDGKSEREPPEHEKNIINISGATLSCRHVTDGVRKLLAVASVYADELGILAGKP